MHGYSGAHAAFDDLSIRIVTFFCRNVDFGPVTSIKIVSVYNFNDQAGPN